MYTEITDDLSNSVLKIHFSPTVHGKIMNTGN